MAVKTPFLKLEKPEYPDAADIAVLNSDMDKIDTGVKTVSDSVQAMLQPASGWDNINVFQVTGTLPDDTTSAVPTAVRPCLICSRNGSMGLYW